MGVYAGVDRVNTLEALAGTLVYFDLVERVSDELSIEKAPSKELVVYVVLDAQTLYE
jgi:hypothetical protein